MYKKTTVIMATVVAAVLATSVLAFALPHAALAFSVFRGGNGGTGGAGGAGGHGGDGGLSVATGNIGVHTSSGSGSFDNSGSSQSRAIANGGDANGGEGGDANGGSVRGNCNGGTNAC